MSFTTNDDPDFNIANGSYKFVEHMGDIAFHVVGNTLPQVYEQTLRAMFSYMCPTAREDILAAAAEEEEATRQQKIRNEASKEEEKDDQTRTQQGMGSTTPSADADAAAADGHYEENDEGVAPTLNAAQTNPNMIASSPSSSPAPDASQNGRGEVRRVLDVKGNSLESLLFSIMNEALYLFHTTHFVPCFSVKVPVLELSEFKSHTAAIGYVEKRSGVQNFSLRCVMEGGFWFPPERNERGVRGTEIKAITKEGLLIDVQEEDGMWHGHSIVDI